MKNLLLRPAALAALGLLAVACSKTEDATPAVDTSNDSLNSAWGDYRTSVDAIEAASGLDILLVLPLSIQNVVEARTDVGPTN